MYDISGLFPAHESPGAVSVERAISELRAGRPVVLGEGACKLLVVPAEHLDETSAQTLERIGGARLILSLHRLGGSRGARRPRADRPAQNRPRPHHLAILDEDARIDAPVADPSTAEEAALDLLRLAQLLPAAVILTLGAPVEGLNEVWGATSALFAREKSPA